MNGKKEHRRRYNEKLQYITDFEQWLEQEPRMIHFIKWRRWKNSRPVREKRLEPRGHILTDILDYKGR